MSINPRLREMIKLHEGLRLTPYQCTAGRWTIGYGHNLEAHSEAIPASITSQEAERWLDADIESAQNACMFRMPYFGLLDPVRRAVLVDMCFNLGINGLCGFKKMLAFVADEKYAMAANEMLNSKWAEQVKGRAARLSSMMANGIWPANIPTILAA